MHIAIILLNWNGKNDTLECLASLEKIQDDHYTIIVADNGSHDGSLDAFEKAFPNVIYVDNKTNLGFAGGYNEAIKFALSQNFDAFFLLNNDTIVDPHILTAFRKAAKQHPNSLFGAKIYLYSKRDTFDHFGGIWNPKKAQFDLIGYREIEDNSTWNTYSEVDYICGCAIFATKDVFEKVGLFDPRFFLFWEEGDFCFRAKALNYQLLICPEAKLWHKVSASFVGGKAHTTYFWWRNRLLWMEKHVGFKSYFTQLTKEIVKLLKHTLLLHLQCLFISKSNTSKLEKKQDQLKRHHAALQGVGHYFSRQFYNGPSWLFKKKT